MGQTYVFTNGGIPLDSAGGLQEIRLAYERFCCNRKFASATSLDAAGALSKQAGSLLSWSTYCVKYASLLATPCACLAWRLHDFATNRHE